jgi:ATP-binding cassette, subfamily B, bacterial
VTGLTSPRQRGGTFSSFAAALTLGWRAHRLAVAGLILIAVLEGLAPIASAWLLRSVLDIVVSAHLRTGLLPVVLALAAVGCATTILPSISQYLAGQVGRAIQRCTTITLFTAIGRLTGLRSLENPAFQDQLRFSQQAASSAPGQVLSGSIALGASALTLSGFLTTLAVLSPVMTIVIVLAAAPAILLERGSARRQAAALRGITHGQRRQSFYAGLLSSIPAAKEIRLFRLGGFFQARMLDELREVQRVSTRADRRQFAVSAALAGLSALVTAGGLLWAGLAAAGGRLTVGDVTLFVVALGSVTASLAMIVNGGALIYQALLVFGSYRDVIAIRPDLPMPAKPVPVRTLREGIELEDVWFRYGPDKPWILRGVSCFIPHGQSVALVGRNGAGKSTIVKLLCRFYDPDHGRILWDGADLRDMDPAELRERVSAVFQDYMAYELSAAQNIAVGDLIRARQAGAVQAAAEAADIHRMLAGLPKGYETLLTLTYFDMADKANPETGVLLSGGQWQRVALARAFLRGSRDLMILDEPSSGLDAEAEYQIHTHLKRSSQGQATVLISHRLNAIRDADHIIVLADGVITEQGSHDSLMARSGAYARLFSLQARGYTSDPIAAGDQQ